MLDADGWKRILISHQLGVSSIDICKTFAEVIKKLTQWKTCLACSLIPFFYNPELRTIEIGEVLHFIAVKKVV